MDLLKSRPTTRCLGGSESTVLHEVVASCRCWGAGRDLAGEEKAAAMCYSKNQ